MTRIKPLIVEFFPCWSLPRSGSIAPYCQNMGLVIPYRAKDWRGKHRWIWRLSIDLPKFSHQNIVNASKSNKKLTQFAKVLFSKYMSRMISPRFPPAKISCYTVDPSQCWIEGCDCWCLSWRTYLLLGHVWSYSVIICSCYFSSIVQFKCCSSQIYTKNFLEACFLQAYIRVW